MQPSPHWLRMFLSKPFILRPAVSSSATIVPIINLNITVYKFSGPFSTNVLKSEQSLNEADADVRGALKRMSRNVDAGMAMLPIGPHLTLMLDPSEAQHRILSPWHRPICQNRSQTGQPGPAWASNDLASGKVCDSNEASPHVSPHDQRDSIPDCGASPQACRVETLLDASSEPFETEPIVSGTEPIVEREPNEQRAEHMTGPPRRRALAVCSDGPYRQDGNHRTSEARKERTSCIFYPEVRGFFPLFALLASCASTSLAIASKRLSIELR